jgi:hypothetical protein
MVRRSPVLPPSASFAILLLLFVINAVVFGAGFGVTGYQALFFRKLVTQNFLAALNSISFNIIKTMALTTRILHYAAQFRFPNGNMSVPSDSGTSRNVETPTP